MAVFNVLVNGALTDNARGMLESRGWRVEPIGPITAGYTDDPGSSDRTTLRILHSGCAGG